MEDTVLQLIDEAINLELNVSELYLALTDTIDKTETISCRFKRVSKYSPLFSYSLV